jgi:C-terminal processing protease CtpA/Prc
VISFRADAEAVDGAFRFRPKGTGLVWIKSGSIEGTKVTMDAVITIGPILMTGELTEGKAAGSWTAKKGTGRGSWSAEPAQARVEMTTDERKAEFRKLWESIRDRYIFFKTKKVDFDAIMQEFEPKVAAAGSDKEFYGLVRSSMNRLKDGHVSMMVDPTGSFPGRLPVVLRLIGERVFVQRLLGGGGGLQAGDEILEVDGKTGAEALAAASQIRSFPVETTRLARGAQAVGNGLPGTVAKLKVRRGTAEMAIDVTRIELSPVPDENREIVFSELGSGLAVLKVPSFIQSDFMQAVRASIEKAKSASGLVIDLRGNGGGQLMYCLNLLGLLLGEPGTGTVMMVRGDAGEPVVNEAGSTVTRRVPPAGAGRFEGKVAVIIDELGFSGTEVFAAMFRENNRGKVFGRQTGGGCGAVQVHSVRGECFVAFSSVEVRPAGGTIIEGNGVKPDVEVALTLDEVLGKSDPTLDAALNWLREEAMRHRPAA